MNESERHERMIDALEDDIMSTVSACDTLARSTGFTRLQRATELLEKARCLVRDECIAHRKSMGKTATGERKEAM